MRTVVSHKGLTVDVANIKAMSGHNIVELILIKDHQSFEIKLDPLDLEVIKDTLKSHMEIFSK